MTTDAGKKNILLIMTDQQRWDTLNGYRVAGECASGPSTAIRSPHIDALAARGVRFDAAYTATSPCSPARAALFTGLYPHQNDVLANGGRVNPEAPNLAGELADAGYQLGYAGKWHVDKPLNPSDYGFAGHDFPDYGYPIGDGLVEGLQFGGPHRHAPPHYAQYLRDRGLEPPKVLEAYYGDSPAVRTQEMYALQSGDIESHIETMVVEYATELLRGFAQADRPFFLWANFWGPHTPCLIPEPYYSMYDPASVPYEPSFAETWANKPAAHDLYERYWGLAHTDWVGWQGIIARYWGYCTLIDDLVGRLLGELERLGLADDTVVIYTTDHGDQMGAHRLIEKGPFAYEESWRIPLIIAHPECGTSGASDEFVYLHDLYATLLEIADVPSTASDGGVASSKSLLNLALGRQVSIGRDSVYGSFHDHILPAPLRFVRTRMHKLVYNRCDRGELYDLIDDPYELRNLIAQPEAQAIKTELLARMGEYMEDLQDPLRGPFQTMAPLY